MDNGLRKAESAADTAKILGTLQYPGGKARLAGWIANLLPPPGTYRTFVDVFGGAANVLLEVMRRNDAAGIRGVLYVYNDVDEELVNFFRVLREPDLRRELREMLRWTPFSRRQFAECLEMPVPADPVRRAWRFFTINRQSYSGTAKRAGEAGRWGYMVAADGGRGPSQWLNAQERLEALGEAFRRVQVECLDFVQILRRYAAPEVLVYCDPPYHPATRIDLRVYRVEMPAERHRELAEMLIVWPGMAAVSGYRCADYDAWYAGWERHDTKVPCSLSRVGTGSLKGCARPYRVESIWLNPAAARAGRKGEQLRISWEGCGSYGGA